MSSNTVNQRVNFASTKNPLEYPDFLEVQLKSFQDFLQLDTPPEKRKNEGLYKVFAENFPIADTRNNFVLEFLDYYIDPPRYTIDDCIERGLTYSVPLKAKLKLYCTDPDHEDFDTVIQDVFLGPIPYMTDKATFVINGAERVVVSQLHRSPGVFFGQSVHANGTQIKTVENDGYSAVQVGFGDKKEKVVEKDANGKKSVAHRHGVNKAQMGHFKKAGVSGKRFVREFKFENADEYNLADEIKADIFAEGDKVDVTAISKGKGFQGAIKRLGQHRGPMAHGSKFHRHQGSNGACSSPSKVFKGKGMPGHMGSVKVTTQNLEVVRVDADKNLLLIKGAVPGAKKALITVKETTKSGK